jgi:hypothetical protein
MRRFAGAAAAALLLSLACSWDGVRESQKPNEPPSVRITGGAADGNDVDYRVEFFWFGSDPDGTVDHFRYAIDDTCMCSYSDTMEVVVGGDTLTVIEDVQAMTAEECLARGLELNYESPDSIWKRTDLFSGSFNFSARNATADPHQMAEWHTFYVRAVDDRGAVSPIDKRYFNATTIAPTVWILAPLPPGGDFSTVSTFFNVRWAGRDEDSSQLDKRPVGYQLKFIKISDNFVPESFVKAMFTSPSNLAPNLLIPDSLVASGTYAPTDWYPKVDAPFTETLLRFQNVEGGAYAFAVRAVDEAGSITPDADMGLATGEDQENQGSFIKLDVNPAVEVHPHITIRERNLLGSQKFTSYGQEWITEVPANVPLWFEWEADASWYGSRVEAVNYAIDIPDPGCEVCLDPRGEGGWVGWGNYEGIGREITFTEEDAGEQHRLYVRARDESFSREREMLAVVTMTVVAFEFDKAALWIDDCVFPGDRPNDCDYEDFLRPLLTDAIAPYLQDGEVLEQWQSHTRGSNQCNESNSDPLDLNLSRIGRYRLLYWDVSNAGAGTALGELTDPNPNAARGKFLSIYVRAGGKLIVWGRNSIAEMLGGIRPEGPYYPDLPIFSEHVPVILAGTFVWDILRFRTQFDRVGRGTVPSLKPPCSGLLGLEATQKAIDQGFPAGVPDPTGYDPSRVGLWIDRWHSDTPPSENGEVGLDVPTGLPPLRVAGLDTLYTYISNSWSWLGTPDGLMTACGSNYLSIFEDMPIVMRFDDPTSLQGRVAWLGSALWWFHAHHAEDATLLMRLLTDWVFAN